MNRPFVSLCLLLFLSLLPLPSQAAGPARLAADLEPSEIAVPHAIYGMLGVNGRAVYVDYDNETYLGLWATDGTPAGTRSLGDLCPACSGISPMASTGSVAFYQASESGSGQSWIWRTDGEPAGTYPAAGPFLLPGFAPGGGRLHYPFALGGPRLFFTACTPESGCELWSSTGSPAETAMVAEIAPGPAHAFLREVRTVGERAFVLAGNADEDVALWVVDQTTRIARRLASTPNASLLITTPTRAYFLASGPNGSEVWTSDGTAAGTRPLTRFQPNAPFNGSFLKAIGERVYFAANDGTHGRELWTVAGGQESSLRRLSNVKPPQAVFSGPVAAGKRIVFTVSRELWTSRGDLASTGPLGCAGGCPRVDGPLVPVQPGRIVFKGEGRGGDALWVTDGTAAGTSRLQRTGARRSLVQAVTAGGRALFEVTDEYLLGELWITDGTAAGTFHAADGGPSWSHYFGWSGPLVAGATAARLVFPGLLADQVDSALWASAGRPAGTQPITRLEVGRTSSPLSIVPFRDGILVQTCLEGGLSRDLWFLRDGDATQVLSEASSACSAIATPPIELPAAAVFLKYGEEGLALTSTDGTPEGTRDLVPERDPSEPEAIGRFGDRAVFWILFPYAAGGGYTSEIWLTDGTPAGTQKLASLPDLTGAYQFEEAGGRLYFFNAFGQDGQLRYRPWISDGTTAGTHPLIDRLGEAVDARFVEAGGKVYFLFSPVGGTGGNGVELWSTDGTAAGTGPALAGSGILGPTRLASAGGRLYIAAQREGDPPGRLRPWVSDGTVAGTRVLADVELVDQAPVLLAREPFVEAGDRVYFPASDAAHGLELWSTDGTPEGTALVRDVFPGPLGSYPDGLAAWNGKVWFSAVSLLHGQELWTSDGTAEGTREVQDISPGASWSTPRLLTPAAEGLWFTAHDGEHGREVWELPE